jgi:hypothetical protein
MVEVIGDSINGFGVKGPASVTTFDAAGNVFHQGDAGVVGDGQIGVLGFAQDNPNFNDPRIRSADEPYPLGSQDPPFIASAGVYGVCIGTGPVLGPAGTAGTSIEFTGVAGSSGSGTGVYGQSGDGAPLPGNAGVVGTSDTKTGVAGVSNRAPGVFGQSGATDKVAQTGTAAVVGWADTVTGVAGASNSAPGVFGSSFSPDHSSIHGQRGSGGRAVDASAVLGTTDDTKGAGVSGSALNTVGVFGLSGNESGPGVEIAGVVGTSSTVTGVAGSSGQNYGGHFVGGLAPILLEPASNSGRPRSGTHRRGELYVDSQGALFFCIADGTPGTWCQVQLSPPLP